MVQLILWLFTSFFLLFTNGKHIPYNAEFHSPIGIPLVLAANFGEVRSNHFHTGIDIKTSGKIGYRVYAVADGYVSRVHISPYGYGRVVYVSHPQLGLTTVYAHCSRFVEEIDTLVKKHQRKQKENNIDYYFSPGQIQVKKGEQIALSGNSGGSSGPHLHFEIRDMFTEHPYNPLLFDFFNTIQDHRKPMIRRIKVYALNENGVPIPNIYSSRRVHHSHGKNYIADNLWTISSNFCSKNGGIGFSVDAIDLLDAAYNRCGIFESALLVNGDTVFQQNMAELDFSTNRYINSHVDHEEFIYHRRMLQKQFKTPYNKLDIYPVKTNGVYQFQPDSIYTIKYVCTDAKGNKSKLKFKLKITAGKMRTSYDGIDNYTSNFLYPDSSYSFENENYSIQFPAHILYQPIEKEIQIKDNHLFFGDSDIPLNDVFKLSLKSNVSSDTNHSIVVVESKNGYKNTLTTKYKNGYFKAEPKQFGIFYLAIDSLKPEVKNYNFSNGELLSTTQQLKWKINDDFSGITKYNLYIDGKWNILYFNYKKDEIIAQLKMLSTGKHTLKLLVEDGANNINESNYTIVIQ